MVSFRPVHDLSTAGVIGYYTDTSWGSDTPQAWLAEADAFDLRPSLEVKALRRSLAILPDLPAETSLIVSCSTTTLVTSELLNALRHSEPTRIIVQLTQSGKDPDYTAARNAADQLRRLGTKIMVEHDRAHSSALRLLIELQPDLINLTSALPAGNEDHALATLISLARLIGATLLISNTASAAARARCIDLGIQLGVGDQPAPAFPLSA